jgi:hypothetical protein
VLQLAKTVIACSGYRVAGWGTITTTFEALEIAVGPTVSELLAYFDTCRLKRYHIDYDYADVISDSEADELLAKAGQFRKRVDSWILKHHPELTK